MTNEERKSFFIKRIGRRIFRTPLPNSSPADDIVYNVGQIIYNSELAEWLFSKENAFGVSGTPVTYFSSKADRDIAILQMP